MSIVSAIVAWPSRAWITFGLKCDPSCRTFAEPVLAHRIASEAAERAGLVTGQRLQYQAFDTSTGRIQGAVRALAGGQS